MGYRTILINYQDPDRAEAQTEAGIALAQASGAHLIGFYAIPKVQYFYATAAVQIATEVFEAEQKFFQDQAERIRSVFQREMPGDVESEWRCVEAQGPVTTNTTVEHGLRADLIITGQVNPDQGLEGEVGAPERLVMESGRPVLMLPYAGRPKTLGRNILVAWNGTREAARAIADALPLLKAAKQVKLLWINPSEGDGGRGTGTPGSEMAANLSRHGVKVEASHTVAKQIGVGDELLSRAADQGADLIVMGAYGHSRVREYVFGGATHHILRHMTVPVLMSH